MRMGSDGGTRVGPYRSKGHMGQGQGCSCGSMGQMREVGEIGVGPNGVGADMRWSLYLVSHSPILYSSDIWYPSPTWYPILYFTPNPLSGTPFPIWYPINIWYVIPSSGTPSPIWYPIPYLLPIADMIYLLGRTGWYETTLMSHQSGIFHSLIFFFIIKK